MASVVVPMFRISEQSLGTCSATARASTGLPSAVQGFALGVGRVLHHGAGHAHATVKAGEQASSARRCTSRRTVTWQ